VSVNLNGASEKEALSAYRKKFIAGATATVLALGALVGFAGPASADTQAPLLTSAETTIDGSAIVLDYDEALDPGSTPSDIDFTVSTSTARTVTIVAISGDTVRLTLSAPVAFGDDVSVSYVGTATRQLQDLSANVALDLTDQIVTNIVPEPDTTAPVFGTAETTTNGLVLVLNYNETLDVNSTPVPINFVVSGDTIRSVTGVEISGDTVRLTLDPVSPIAFNEGIFVSYTAAAGPIQDIAGNDAANLTDEPVTNNVLEPTPSDTTAPIFVSAETTTNGLVIVLDYDEALDSGSTPANGDFTISSDTARTVTGVEISGATVRLTLDVAIAYGDLVTVSYVSDPALAIQDIAGNDVANLTDAPVTNNVPEPDTTAPTLSSSTPADGATNVAINSNVTLNFNEDIVATTTDLTRVYLKDVLTDTTVASSVTIVSGNVVINPTANLANDTDYYVTWSANTLRDAANNSVLAVSNETTLNFRTVAASSGGGGGSSGGGGGAVVDSPTMKKHTLAFGINSAKTNKEIRASVRRILAGSPDATSVVCRPVISATNTSAAAKKLARDRSKAVCDYINRLTPVIEVRVAKAYLVVDNSKQRRTVRITIG
jgi:uncharacterized repeat protein (TIGR02059 family)